MADWFGLPFAVTAVPPYFFVGFAFIPAGAQVIRMPTVSGVEKYMVGWGMILWGIHNLDFPFLRDNASFAPYGITIASVLKIFTAFAMTILSIRRELAGGPSL